MRLYAPVRQNITEHLKWKKSHQVLTASSTDSQDFCILPNTASWQTATVNTNNT